MNIELHPWPTPDFVFAKMSPRERQYGFTLGSPQWELKDVDEVTLSKMCDDFRKEIFRKAGKIDAGGWNPTVT